MHARDRVVEFRRIPAGRLRPHPLNWRSHPPAQRAALAGVLAEVGFAGALLVRPLAGGDFELIDGHLRAETLPLAELPALVLDLDAAEAAKLLALFDPLAALAVPRREALAELVSRVESECDAVNVLLANLLETPNKEGERAADGYGQGGERPAARPMEPAGDALVEAYQVLVECDDEAQQRSIYERLTSEGLRCRLLML
ncbi:MAG: ParB N-terminal domain-containing protein [Pirellulales bacterium]|nr:ParB N-terminal domain-containing protein [Pirellulales bacterium]